MAKDLIIEINNSYNIPSSIGIVSKNKPIDVRDNCDTVDDFETAATNGMDLRYHGLITTEKETGLTKICKLIDGNYVWEDISNQKSMNIEDDSRALLVADYTHSGNAVSQPISLNFETGVFTFSEPHGFSVDDKLTLCLNDKNEQLNPKVIPRELITLKANYSPFKVYEVIDEYNLSIKNHYTDKTTYDNTQIDVDVTKFHFQKGATIIKFDNLPNLGNKYKIKIKRFGGYSSWYIFNYLKGYKWIRDENAETTNNTLYGQVPVSCYNVYHDLEIQGLIESGVCYERILYNSTLLSEPRNWFYKKGSGFDTRTGFGNPETVFGNSLTISMNWACIFTNDTNIKIYKIL